MGRPAEPSLLFLHVRKTGGTALARALSNRFAADDCLTLAHSPPQAKRNLDDFRYVAGHLDMSAVRYFSRRPYVVTCLREPVERALSAYSYYRWSPPEHDAVLRADLGEEAWPSREAAMGLAKESSVGEFLSRAPDLAREHFGNVQARMLCGLASESDGETLDGALAGLEECDFVGLTERLDDSARHLAARLGWADLGELPRENVTEGRVRREELDSETLAALSRLTELDARVYADAAERFERQDGRAEAVPADAQVFTDLSFADPIHGAGWCGREAVEDGWICWLGSTRSAWVGLRAPGVSRLEVEGPFAIHDSVMEGLRLTVDGRTITHRLEGAENGYRLVALEPLDVSEGSIVTVGIEVDRGFRPRDLDPSSIDLRELAIAVRRIALVPASPPARSSALGGRARAAVGRLAHRVRASRRG